MGFWPKVSTKYGFQFEWNLFLIGIYCPKNTQIDAFGHFLNFAWLVFLDFAHNGRWAWCLVVFLQFAGTVNVFLLLKKHEAFQTERNSFSWNTGLYIQKSCFFIWNASSVRKMLQMASEHRISVCIVDLKQILVNNENFASLCFPLLF